MDYDQVNPAVNHSPNLPLLSRLYASTEDADELNSHTQKSKIIITCVF